MLLIHYVLKQAENNVSLPWVTITYVFPEDYKLNLNLQSSFHQQLGFPSFLMQIGKSDPSAYPIQKKRVTREFLRTVAHLRPRTNTFGAVCAYSTIFYQFYHLHLYA